MLVEQLIGLALVLVGSFIALAGVLGWKWVWRGRRIRWLVRLVGQVGTRISYVLAGFTLLGAGMLMLSGG